MMRNVTMALVALATACTSSGYSSGYDNVTVDGTQSQEHQLPPVGYECYPRYRTRDGYVYNVNGVYYHERNGNWSILRSTPKQVRYEEPVISNERRCLGYPP
jgi:hypothetical protein